MADDDTTRRTATTVGAFLAVGITSSVPIGAALENVPVTMATGAAVGIVVGVAFDLFNRWRDRDDSS